MHHRLLSWLFLCLLAGVFTLGAQTQPVADQPGQVRVIKVVGKVTRTLGNMSEDLKLNDFVPQAARINTAMGASVVLAFSNGAQIQLGEDTELIIDQFIQDPFAATVAATVAEEPTRSATTLTLNKGELIGKVAKLKRDSGSTFTVQTPVGAAGIRGTTFRIVFRPTGNGLALFQLSTLEGDVSFTVQDPGAPGVPGGLTAVTDGLEVVLTVSVTVTATGEIVLTALPQFVSAVALSPETQALITREAQAIAIVAATSPVFLPTPPPGTPPSNPPAPPATETPTPQEAPPPPPTPPPPRITTPDGAP